MVQEADGTLGQIALLLEERPLTDPRVLDLQSWKEKVLPVTRPFLARVKQALGFPANFANPGPATVKRDVFDHLSANFNDDFFARVTVGLSDEPEGDLEHVLSWGVGKWGGREIAAPFQQRLSQVQAPGFRIRTIDGSKAGGFSGGTTVLLCKSLTPEALRTRSLDTLVGEIAGDLTYLKEQMEKTRPILNGPNGPKMSATAISAWLRGAHGLYFTPYQVAAFVTALQAKGFVILSGLSGTGKTQLAVRIAKLVLGRAPEVIPVRPDWRDSRGLLGYYNPISERYVSTPLLRQLLPDQEPPESPPPRSAVDFQRVRQAIAREQERWIPALRQFVDRLEKLDASALSEQDLDEIWRPMHNGIASIGQAVGTKLQGDGDVLREATRRLRASESPGEGMVAALHYLREQGNDWHWARALRALAVFRLDETSTVAHRHALRDILRALGYPSAFRLSRAVWSSNTRAIDDAFQFLRRTLDERLPGLDRFEKAVAPWLIYEQLVGAQPTRPSEIPPTVIQHRFIILDEMNLARVEYYFAEFLSVLESDRDRETGMTVQALPLHAERGLVRDGPPDDSRANDIPSDLSLPPYLYVVGTVNTDETTHAFSPKVLDRAFTLELNDVDLRQVGGGQHVEEVAFGRELARLLADTLPDQYRKAAAHAMQDPRFFAWLAALYNRLRPYDLHFGYRTRDEIARFVGYALASPLKDGFQERGPDIFIGAFDAALLMKVLPKFHGPRAKLGSPLTSVLAWAVDPDQPGEAHRRIERALETSGAVSAEALLQTAIGDGASHALLPRTAQKAARMLYEVVTVGFASFA
ncbi:MAG: hypothetical protein H0V51_20270 [Chloroflexi bacterium]|nr:hypothetical protein [Chloroflexota bacterium]